MNFIFVRQLYFLKSFIKDAPNKAINSTTINKAIVIQSGLVTHHHDQSITPANFSIKNTMNTVPAKSDPCELLSDIIYIVLIIDT